MLLSLCYLVLRDVLQLTALRCRSSDFKDIEIIVLRHRPASCVGILPTEGDDARPAVPRRGKSLVSQEAVAVLSSSRQTPCCGCSPQ